MNAINIYPRKADNNIMASVYGDMVRILQYFEKSIDLDTFDTEHFNEKCFNVSVNRFCRLLQLLIEEDYIKGVTVHDMGEQDEASKIFDSSYTRYSISIDSPAITLKGLRFMAENTVLARTCRTIKGIKDLLP